MHRSGSRVAEQQIDRCFFKGKKKELSRQSGSLVGVKENIGRHHLAAAAAAAGHELETQRGCVPHS